MKNKIDRILLVLLWVLVVFLVASFWFSVIYDFNLFSSDHWHYLSSLQATKSPVTVGFYITLFIFVFILLLGVYLLIRPKFKTKHLPVFDITNQKQKVANLPFVAVKLPQMTARPPHPANLPSENLYKKAPNSPKLSTPTLQRFEPPVPNQNRPELETIFKDAGYVIKKRPIISGVPISLFAIGINETVWVGSVGIKTTDMRRAIDTLNQVFIDTLEDIDIDVNGFVINAPDADSSEFQDILMFSSASELKDYMKSHKNPPVPDDEKEDFDAYSEYVDTVINYIRKL